MSAKQKILHGRGPSSLNLGIFVCSWWHSSPTAYSANDKSKKENTFGGYPRLFAWVLRAFLTKHWIHTRAECDFAKSRFLCVQCPLKIPYPQSLCLKNWPGDPTFLMQKNYSAAKAKCMRKVVKKNCGVGFFKSWNFHFSQSKQNLLYRISPSFPVLLPWVVKRCLSKNIGSPA